MKWMERGCCGFPSIEKSVEVEREQVEWQAVTPHLMGNEFAAVCYWGGVVGCHASL